MKPVYLVEIFYNVVLVNLCYNELYMAFSICSF